MTKQKGIPVDEQLNIIDEIRRGNKILRDEYIMNIYDRVVGYVNALELKEEYKEDAIQVGIEKAINMIDSYDFRNAKNPIGLVFYIHIHIAIRTYFIENLYFSGMVNGVTYNNIYSYLKAKLGRQPNSREVITYLNEYGVSEKPLSYTNTDDNYPEQAVLDDEAMKVIFKAASYLKDSQRYILFSRNGWFGYKEKSINELATEFSCSPTNIKDTYTKIKRKLCSNPQLLAYLKKQSIEDYLKNYRKYILGRVTGWFGYPKKSIGELAYELKCSYTDVAGIYSQEFNEYRTYIFRSIVGWDGYPKKSIDGLASELECSHEEIIKIFDEAFIGQYSLPLDDDVNKRLVAYLSTLPASSIRFLVSINGWFGVPKKSASELANITFSEARIRKIYNQEISKLKTSLFLEEGKGRKRRK